MSDRHDLRRQIREIHEALGRFEREQLIEILTHLFRTYVMEGASLAPPPPSTLADETAGMTFPQIIERLQLRSDLPELQLFEVQGNRVSVRIEGRLMPLELPTARSEAPPRPVVVANLMPAPPSIPVAEVRAAAPAPAPAPGVMPAGEAGSARPEGGARAASPMGSARATSARPAAPPAAAASSGAGGRPSAPAPAPAPAAAPAPAPAAPKPESRPAEDTGQGGRFGLLEID